MKNKDDIGKGVTFVDINVKHVNPNKTSEYLCSFLTLYFGTFGTMLLLLSSFKFDIDIGLVIFMTFLICLIPYLTFYIIKKRFYIYLIVSGLFFVFVAIFCRQIIESGAISINTIIKGISIPYKLDFPMLNTPVFGGIGSADMQLFVYLLTFIVSMIVGHEVFIRHSLIAAMALPLSIALFCISFDVIPSVLSIVLVTGYLLSVLSMTTKPKLEINPTVPGIVFGMFFAIFIVICIILPNFNYHRFVPFESVRIWVMNTFDPLDIGNAKNTDRANGGINGGHLGEFDGIDYSNIGMLTLRAASNGENLYYKGFTGASYDNNSWGELPSVYVQKYQSLFDNLKRNNVDTNVQTTTLMNIMNADEQLQINVNDSMFDFQTDVQKQEYSVKYLNADKKFWYIPYASAKLSSIKSSADGYPVNNAYGDYDSYSYNVENIDYSKIKKLVDAYKGDNALMKAYVDWEAQYRKYVYDAYTYLPQNSLEEIKADGKKHTVTTEAQKQLYINQVIQNFTTNYKYSLEPGKVPEGKDFAEYFLNESKEGYCTYFATAATLLFRAAGIPARYVEGYTVFDSDISSGIKSSSFYFKSINNTLVKKEYSEYTITVRDSNAHAWVEVYEDGYGWVPIEVTPGMTATDHLSNTSTDQSNTVSESTAAIKSSTASASTENIDNLNDATVISAENNMNSDVKNSLIVIFVVTMILVIIGMIMIWILMYRKARKSLRELLSMESNNSTNIQILAIYRYFERLCMFLEISKASWMDYEDYAKYLNEKLKYFSECNIDAIINTVLKVRFSNCEALEEEALQVTIETFKLREIIYSHLGRLEKIKFKYFYKL